MMTTSQVAAEASGPTFGTLQAAEGIICRTVLEFGEHADKDVLAVPRLVDTIKTVVAGVLSKDIEQRSRTANLLVWHLNRALHGLGVEVAPEGVEALHQHLGALLQGSGQPLKPLD